MTAEINSDWYLLVEDTRRNAVVSSPVTSGGRITGANGVQGRYEAEMDGRDMCVVLDDGTPMILVLCGAGIVTGHMTSSVEHGCDRCQPAELVRGMLMSLTVADDTLRSTNRM